MANRRIILKLGRTWTQEENVVDILNTLSMKEMTGNIVRTRKMEIYCRGKRDTTAKRYICNMGKH